MCDSHPSQDLCRCSSIVTDDQSPLRPCVLPSLTTSIPCWSTRWMKMGIKCRWEGNSLWKKMNTSTICQSTHWWATSKSPRMCTTEVAHEHLRPWRRIYTRPSIMWNVTLSSCRSGYSQRRLYVRSSEWSIHWQLPERSDAHLAVFRQLHGLFQAVSGCVLKKPSVASSQLPLPGAPRQTPTELQLNIWRHVPNHAAAQMRWQCGDVCERV